MQTLDEFSKYISKLDEKRLNAIYKTIYLQSFPLVLELIKLMLEFRVKYRLHISLDDSMGLISFRYKDLSNRTRCYFNDDGDTACLNEFLDKLEPSGGLDYYTHSLSEKDNKLLEEKCKLLEELPDSIFRQIGTSVLNSSSFFSRMDNSDDLLKHLNVLLNYLTKTEDVNKIDDMCSYFDIGRDYIIESLHNREIISKLTTLVKKVELEFDKTWKEEIRQEIKERQLKGLFKDSLLYGIPTSDIKFQVIDEIPTYKFYFNIPENNYLYSQYNSNKGEETKNYIIDQLNKNGHIVSVSKLKRFIDGYDLYVEVQLDRKKWEYGK